MKAIMILFFTLFSFLTIAQDLTEVQKQQLDVNYLINGGFENGKAGWSTYNDGASASPVDGVGGTANITLTTTTTLPHEGKVSGVLTKDAVNRQGQGIKRDFLIPDIAKGKVVRLKFSYEITSGTYASGDTAVWIYDVTNSRLIQPNAYTIENSGLKESKFVEFQSSIDSNSYRLIVHVTSTSASAYTLKFDSFGAGLGPKIYGSVVTDWVAYTPTGGFTNTTYTGKYRRIGDSIEVRARGVVSGVPTGNFTVSIPSGFTIDGTKFAVGSATALESLGTVSVYDASVGIRYAGNVAYNGTSSVRFITHASTDISPTVPVTFAAGDIIETTFSVPIAGWSTTQQLSQYADTRVVSAIVNGNPANTSAGGIIIFPTVQRDTHASYNATTGRYSVPVEGFYQVEAFIYGSSGANGILQVYVDGVATTPALGVINSSVIGGGSVTVYARAGQLLDVRSTNALTGLTAYNGVSFKRVSGPSQISASESVVAVYGSSSGQSIPNATDTIVNFTTKVIDSHNAFNTSTSTYTIPASGSYSVCGRISINPAASGRRFLQIYKNNAGAFPATILDYRASAGASYNTFLTGCHTLPLLTGETIKFNANQDSGGALSLAADSAFNNFSIIRVGNY